MYILERLEGVITYSAVLFIICFLILKFPKKKVGKILFIYTIILSAMGFFYVPASGADLYRLIPIMHIYTNLSLHQLIEVMKTSSTPMTILYYFIIGKFGIDGLLPAITAFITYSNIFYIFKDHIKNNENIDKENIALTLFFIMSTGFFISTISGIRTMLTFSIIARCIYNEMVKNKSMVKDIPIYLLASLIHPVGLALTIMRLGFFIFIEKKENKIIKVVILIIIFIVIFIFMEQKYITSMIIKINNYFKDGDYFLVEEFMRIWVLIIEILIIHIFYKRTFKNTKEKISTNNIMKFSFLINILVALININEFNIFVRFTYLNTILNIPIIMTVLGERTQEKYNKKLAIIIFILSTLSLIMSVTRGSLSSLKFH